MDDALVGTFFRDLEELEGYRRELSESGLPDAIAEARAEFEATVSGKTVRGNEYKFGAHLLGAERLYALLRARRPEIVVETGVCNGGYTAIILQALSQNGSGELHSIDFPEFEGQQDVEFWSEKGGAVVPAGKEPGWLVPTRLRDRWKLVLGRSQDELPPLLHRLGTIDLFLHDSEHSYECMSFEYRIAYEHLRERGLLASDDITWNTAFEDFVTAVSRRPYALGGRLALIEK